MRIVVALGENALLRRGEPPNADAHRAGVIRTATAIAALAHDHDLVLTHGNAVQLDLLATQNEAGPYALDLLTAQTQGQIGTLLVRALQAALPGRRVCALVTHTQVRGDDPAFERPAAFVGPSYRRAEARALAARHGWYVAEDTDGWRRVVPAPDPVRIVETDTVRALLDLGTLVVCAGGGGVPVVAGHADGVPRRTEALVDQDLAAAVLAEDLKADFLLLLTDVPNLHADRRPLLDATPSELRRAPRPGGPLGPKTEAAARFVDHTGGLAAIGALDAAYDIVHGRSGTLIRPELPSL